MNFTEIDKKKALAIVSVFETGKPLGDYEAVAVLNDGAGISYGISQFTHRSGSLLEVIEEYLLRGGTIGRWIFDDRCTLLRSAAGEAIGKLAGDRVFKNFLRAAAATPEMRAAQDHVAEKKYLHSAIRACEGSRFTMPLSLAVIYDSMTHGSYARIRDLVRITPSETSPLKFEKEWITEYVRRRDGWLSAVRRLKMTRYRTRFFRDQIVLGNWTLELPANVHGVRLTNELLGIQPDAVGRSPIPSLQRPQAQTEAGPNNPPNITPSKSPGLQPSQLSSLLPRAQPKFWKSVFNFLPNRPNQPAKKEAPSALDKAESRVNAAAETFDRVDRIATAVITRTDRAKSLWTAVTGTLFQTAWALLSFAAGLPKEAWFFAAGVAAALALMYLYRQIALGKMRERSELRP